MRLSHEFDDGDEVVERLTERISELLDEEGAKESHLGALIYQLGNLLFLGLTEEQCQLFLQIVVREWKKSYPNLSKLAASEEGKR